MENIENRAIVAYPDEYNTSLYYDPDQDINIELRQAYIKGATEQKAIDIEKALSFLRYYGEGDFSCREEFEAKFRKAMEDKK